MSKNTEEKEMKTKQEKIKEPVSSQEESSSSEKKQDELKEKKNKFCENVFHEMKDVEMGALFAGVENVVIGANKINTKITQGVNGLLSKVTGYFRNSIDSYKKTRK